MTEESKSNVHVHVLTSGETRNPIGSKASLDTMVSDAGTVYLVNLSWNGKAFDPEVLGEEDPQITHLEAHIRQHGLTGTWKLGVTTPLWDAIWERNSDGDWICIEAGLGYA